MIRYMKGNLGVEGIEHIQNMLTQAADIMNDRKPYKMAVYLRQFQKKQSLWRGFQRIIIP